MIMEVQTERYPKALHRPMSTMSPTPCYSRIRYTAYLGSGTAQAMYPCGAFHHPSTDQPYPLEIRFRSQAPYIMRAGSCAVLYPRGPSFDTPVTRTEFASAL
jgi:hypothetical protein